MLSSRSVRNGKMSLVKEKGLTLLPLHAHNYHTAERDLWPFSAHRKHQKTLLSDYVQLIPSLAFWDRDSVTQQTGGTPHSLTPTTVKLRSLLAFHLSFTGKLESPLPSLSFLRHKEGFNLSHVAAFLNLFQSL